MIYLYSGTPGSGKSYHASKEIYDKLFVCKNVIANFEINEDIARMTPIGYFKYKIHKKFKIDFKKYNQYRKSGDFLYIDNSEMTPRFFMEYAFKHHDSHKEGQTLVVIDECGVIFNPRSWDGKARMDWIKFFSMHRHYGYDFVLISQSDRMIDRQIRCLLEYDVKHRDAKNFGFIGKLFGLLFRNHIFACITYWYGVKEKVSVQLIPVNNRIFDLYDTFKVFDSKEGVKNV